jgi:flagellar hook-associated protein 3 FlgL
MRIATSQYQTTVNRSLQLNQERVTYVMQQMASGNRIQLPSDDPIGNVRMSRLNREQALLTQYQDNIATVQVRLTKNENYLSSLVSDMNQVRDVLVSASDASNTTDDLAAKVSSLAALRDSMLYTANVKDAEGNYQFSGTMTSTPALTYDATAAVGSRYTYTGNTGIQSVVVGNGVTQAVNVDLSGLETMLNQLDTTISTLSTPGVKISDPIVSTVVASNLDSMDATMNQIATKIATFGGAQNILTTLNTNHTNVALSNDMALIDIGQLDYATAATDLNGYQSALEATYKAYAKVGSLSLFDTL